MGSSLGRVFVVTTFGESHGRSVGAVIDGCPSRLPLEAADIQPQLDRRRPGQSHLTTSRDEKDTVEIMAGVENGLTLGSPIMLLIGNHDQRTVDYEEVANIPRPSQADFTYHAKYGVRSSGGGGRASARETAGRVAAGAVAEALLRSRRRVDIVAWVSSVGTVDCPQIDMETLDRATVDGSELRCPDPDSAREMTALIEEAADRGDSLGGVVTCVCRNVPVGWGEPVFEKAEARLAGAMLSIPATKGFEIGSGFSGTRMKGSEHNDAFVRKGDRIGTATNRSGGIQAGITNGEPIVMRVAFKPVATIRLPQNTVDFDGNPVVLEITKGRHDPCVLPRAVPIVESMAALVLADLCLLAER